MFVLIFIWFMKALQIKCKELVLHRFESINDTMMAPELVPSVDYYCKIVENNIVKSKCDGFSCWESQLRDTTRIEILNKLDEFRSQVFDSHYNGRMTNTNRSIFQMEWHWRLESESRDFLEDCPIYNEETNIIMNLNTRNTLLPTNKQDFVSFECDMAATSFPMQSGSQSELLGLLPMILNENWLGDFNKNDEYRRLNSVYVGCSYLLRDNVTTETGSGAYVVYGVVGHLACMFCAPQNVRIEKRCPTFTKKSAKNQRLCQLITNSTEMPCELNLIKCPLLEKSMTWMFTPKTLVGVVYGNETYKILSKRMEVNSLESTVDLSLIKFPTVVQVFITPYVVHIDLFDRKFCIVLCLVFIFVLTLLFLLLVLIYKNKIILQNYFVRSCSQIILFHF